MYFDTCKCKLKSLFFQDIPAFTFQVFQNCLFCLTLFNWMHKVHPRRITSMVFICYSRESEFLSTMNNVSVHLIVGGLLNNLHTKCVWLFIIIIGKALITAQYEIKNQCCVHRNCDLAKDTFTMTEIERGKHIGKQMNPFLHKTYIHYLNSIFTNLSG